MTDIIIEPVVNQISVTMQQKGAKGDTGTAGSQGVKGDTGNTGSQGAKGDTGSVGIQGDTGNAGIAGVKGDTGSVGAKGDTGTTGTAGAKGDTGNTGTAGAQGDTGTTGVKGDTGNTGNTGSQGVKGDTGNTGVKGDTGTQGDTGSGVKGDTGSQGVKGDTGTRGDTGSGIQGDTGNTGVKGDTGNQGDTGVKGDTGNTGTTGAKGDTGNQGLFGGASVRYTASSTQGGTPATGTFRRSHNTWAATTQILAHETDAGSTDVTEFLNNIAVGDMIRVARADLSTEFAIFVVDGMTDSGSYRTIDVTLVTGTTAQLTNGATYWLAIQKKGPQGDTGTAGSAGAKGDTGTQGDTGVAGAKGDTGNTGTAGAKGDTGSTGAKGDTGSGVQGDTGATGSAGAKGDTGNTGTTGAKGDTGNTGTTGAKGDTGNTGTTGAKGDTGNKGDTGSVTWATTGELDTGTETAKAINPDVFAGSNRGKRIIQVKVIDDATVLTTGDGKAIIMIPVEFNGMNLVDIEAFVTTVSSSGSPTVQIRNITQTADMLTTKVSIDASENTSLTATTAPVIDTANDDVATGDLIAIDVDVSGTGAKGLGVIMSFQTP